MRQQYLATFAGLTLALSYPVAASPPPMRRGINVLGYDPIWKGGRAQFTIRDMQYIRAAGFDSVRININFINNFLGPKYAVKKSFFDILDPYIEFSIHNDMTAIIDFHDGKSLCSDDFMSCKPLIESFWKQVSEHYKDVKTNVAFELLNEPHYPIKDDEWNIEILKLLSIIRRANKSRYVIVSPTGYSSISKLDNLRIPDDKNIGVTIHYYEPRSFTMQFSHEKSVYVSYNIWGSPGDCSRLKSDFKRAQHWAQINGKVLFLGEFGVWDDVPVNYRARYISAVVGAAEDAGMPWAYWQYEYDFRAINPATGMWISPIISALFRPFPLHTNRPKAPNAC